MGFVQHQLVKFVIRVVTFPRTTLAICAVVLLASVAGAWFFLGQSADQEELMTPKLKFFRDYQEFTRRFPESEAFVVILEPKDAARPPAARRWTDLADRMTAALLALKGDVARVDARVPPEDLGTQGLLFDDWENVRAVSASVDDVVQLAHLAGDPTLLQRPLGSNMTRRVLTGLSLGPAGDARGLATEVMGTLASALQTPVEKWRRGSLGEGQVPSLYNADPGAASDPEVRGYFMLKDETKRGTAAYATQKIGVINIYAGGDSATVQDFSGPKERMQAAVEQAARDFPEFKTPVISGRPALEADELAVSDRDARLAEIFGLSLVFVVLLIFLRNLWLVIVAELCLGVGIGWTFGWATISVGRLNLLSLVFVIALIGIGMDYLIQILTRYRFEKKRYTRPQAVWARVFRYVSAPISTACCGAAGAFFVATLTDFQGAAELGIIAGGGLMLCLLAGYTVLPALLTVFPASVGEVHVSKRYRHREAHPRAGGWRLVPAAVWIVVAGAGLAVSLPPRFDPNLLKLQADGLPSVRAVRKLPTWYAVVTSPDLGKLRQMRAAILADSADIDNTASVQGWWRWVGRVRHGSTIDHTESVLEALDKRDWLVQQNGEKVKISWHEPAPPAAADLPEIAAAAESLVERWGRQADAGDLAGVKAAAGRLTTALRSPEVDEATKLARLAEWQMQFVAELRRNVEQFAPPALDEATLPATLRDHLISEPTAPGEQKLYALYVYPKADLWETGELVKFVDELESRVKGGGATGIAPQLLHSTGEIHKAFMLSTIYALVLIFVLVLLDLRKMAQTLLAISVLGLGLPMLLLVMWVWHGVPFGGRTLEEWTGIPGTWNFANFFALPILIGAGHEYGVFMVHRYREALHDPRRVWRVWDVSDRALLLCGIVTSCSFGFMMGAHHHGLQSLGWVMAMGTGCIYLAAVLVVRPVLTWRLKRKKVYEQNDEV